MYVPEYGPADINAVLRQVGLPECDTPQEYVDRGFFIAMYELMSDGELIVQVQGQKAGVTPEERHGDFYTAIKPLWEEALNSPDAPHTKEIQRVGRLVGELLAHQVFNGLLHLPNDSLVQPSFVDFDQIKVGPHTSALPYDKPGVASVLDLGAGLSGKRFIDWMVRRIATQSSFAQYLPINKGPMQSSFLHNYAGYSFNALQPGLANAIIGQYYIGREEGMDEFTEFISAEDTANSMISAVVCNGVSTVDADEVCRSLARVPDMVRPGGVVVVGLCVQPVVEGGAIYDQAHQTLVDAGMNVTDTFSQITGGYNRDQVESRFSIFKHAS